MLEGGAMYDFAGDGTPDLEQLRARLSQMSDDALRRFGASARYMCSPEANLGKPPRMAFSVQLAEAVAEWRRRSDTASPLR
jgi:uncharacterized protein YjiS (DUF1127 family)